jgi:hypothetical protein
MNVELAEERILLLADRFNLDHAEGRAWTKRIEAFGTLAKVTGFLARPKDEEFEIVYRERRLQPFWRITCHVVNAYERTREYRVRVGPEVRSVVIGGGEATAVAGGEFPVTGLETCREETRKDILFDGLTKAADPLLSSYLTYAAEEVSADALNAKTTEGIVLVPPQVKASVLTRDVLSQAISRIEADRVLEETVRLEAIDLYYRPVYAFRYRWQGKEAVVEFDALTGEAKAGGATFETYLGKLVDPRFLLDVGAEAANMFIPGANLAKMVMVKSMEMRKR